MTIIKGETVKNTTKKVSEFIKDSKSPRQKAIRIAGLAVAGAAALYIGYKAYNKVAQVKSYNKAKGELKARRDWA